MQDRGGSSGVLPPKAEWWSIKRSVIFKAVQGER
jgi:hypothetical protein